MRPFFYPERSEGSAEGGFFSCHHPASRIAPQKSAARIFRSGSLRQDDKAEAPNENSASIVSHATAFRFVILSRANERGEMSAFRGACPETLLAEGT